MPSRSAHRRHAALRRAQQQIAQLPRQAPHPKRRYEPLRQYAPPASACPSSSSRITASWRAPVAARLRRPAHRPAAPGRTPANAPHAPCRRTPPDDRGNRRATSSRPRRRLLRRREHLHGIRRPPAATCAAAKSANSADFPVPARRRPATPHPAPSAPPGDRPRKERGGGPDHVRRRRLRFGKRTAGISSWRHHRTPAGPVRTGVPRQRRARTSSAAGRPRHAAGLDSVGRMQEQAIADRPRQQPVPIGHVVEAAEQILVGAPTPGRPRRRRRATIRRMPAGHEIDEQGAAAPSKATCPPDPRAPADPRRGAGRAGRQPAGPGPPPRPRAARPPGRANPPAARSDPPPTRRGRTRRRRRRRPGRNLGRWTS